MTLSITLLATVLAAAPTLVIEHDPVGQCAKGEPFIVGAKIVGSGGKKVFEPVVFARAAGAKDFKRLPMQPGGAVDTFIARLPGELTQGEVEYFIEAFDEDGKGPYRKASPDAPMRLSPSSLPPPPPPMPVGPTSSGTAEQSWKSTPTYLGIGTMGVGVLLLASCGVVGGLALKDRSDQQAAVAAGDYAAWQRARDATHFKAVAADALLGVGIAVAGAGVGLTLWGIAEARRGPRVALQVSGGPGSASALVTGTF